MVSPGADLSLTIEKPAAGGRMIARHEGEIILVSGTLPGERVRAQVEKVGRGVAYARTREILEPSDDRRPVLADPACGGNVYAHISYDRQRALKAEVLADAFARIGRLRIENAVEVAPSPEAGYRMRARFHVRGEAIGFFREGTHDLCDPASTRQLLPESTDALARVSDRVRARGIGGVSSIELAENLPATERVIHLELDAHHAVAGLAALFDEVAVSGVTCSRWRRPGSAVLAGAPFVSDTFEITAAPGRLCPVTLRRHARAFFQGNRYLLAHLVSRVLSRVDDGPVTDLFSGGGLFAVSLAAAGWNSVTAVEGDWASAADLDANALPYGSAVRRIAMPVEGYLRSDSFTRAATLIIDPPRTGLSREAMTGILRARAPRLVFVSCDVATLARDVRTLVEAGYRLDHLEAFDLFPNTAHVEAMAVFTLSGTPR